MLIRTVIASLFAAALASAAEPSIEIDASRVAPRSLPRTIFGTFLEPIGNSVYGGLWAQILENPSFEDNLWSAAKLQAKLRAEPALVRSSELGLPIPWQPLDDRAGWRYEPRWGDAANSARSLLVMGLSGREQGVRQGVYLPTHRLRRFTGSVYAKAVSAPPEITVSLRRRNRPEEVLARQVIPLSGAAWKRYQFAFELAPGAIAPREQVDFVIAVRDEGRVLLDQVELLPADHIDGMNPEMVELSRAMQTPIVRYGGNFTSGYHWRDGIGPQERRVSMLNQSWGMPEYNQFGTDEFLRFCQLIGAEPQIALNLGSGTPEEAADWVRYVNEHWRGHKGGLLWELGNELWGDWQIGYPSLAGLSARTQAFSAAIRAVDPAARLIATGQDPDHFTEWNAAQLKAPEAFSYLSTHFVVTPGDVKRRRPTPEFAASAGLALPVELERKLAEMKQQIDANPKARDRVRIAFTEWLFYTADNRGVGFTNQGGALNTAGFLNMLLRNSEIVPISDMTGLIEFGGIWQKKAVVYGTPAYYAFRLYSTADIDKIVATQIEVDRYDVHEGNVRFPEIANVPYLDAVAALNRAGDKLTVFCLNRSLDRDLSTRIQIAHFDPAASIEVRQLAAESIYEANDENEPSAIIPIQSAVKWNGRYTFPRSSLTVLELKRK